METTMKYNTQTSLYGVIGNPIEHSMSPLMHNSAFIETGYNGAYLAFHVTDLESAIAGVRGLGVNGLSVTIPHKVAIMDLLDEIDDMAVKIGAVNTVVNQDGKLLGYNTDCLGAINALLEKTEIKGKNVVMIGAGGAARAAGFGILAEGGNLTILNILEDEGTRLSKDLGVPYYHLSEFSRFDYDILINTTPVGMSPVVDNMPVDQKDLRLDKVVMDVIYNPLKTKLLAESEKIGCTTVDGVSMFVYQGVAQFEMWTGKKAPVDTMRNIVLKALGE
jgi:shikimate dehydrogenase